MEEITVTDFTPGLTHVPWYRTPPPPPPPSGLMAIVLADKNGKAHWPTTKAALIDAPYAPTKRSANIGDEGYVQTYLDDGISAMRYRRGSTTGSTQSVPLIPTQPHLVGQQLRHRCSVRRRSCPQNRRPAANAVP
jgi:hypothetical protein